MFKWNIALTSLVPTAVMLVLVIGQLKRARRSAAWPTVEATILKSRVGNSGKSGYRPFIKFTYNHGGRVYESSRVYVGWPVGGSEEAAKQTVNRYPAGARVTAAIDPEKPSYCVLVPGFQPSHKTLIFICVVFVVASLGSLIAIVGSQVSQ